MLFLNKLFNKITKYRL